MLKIYHQREAKLFEISRDTNMEELKIKKNDVTLQWLCCNDFVSVASLQLFRCNSFTAIASLAVRTFS